MAIALLLSITLALILALYDIQALVAAAPLLVLWLFSPEIAYWISRPMPQGQDEFSTASNGMFTPAEPNVGTCNTQ